jgi:hypothetical protein
MLILWDVQTHKSPAATVARPGFPYLSCNPVALTRPSPSSAVTHRAAALPLSCSTLIVCVCHVDQSLGITRSPAHYRPSLFRTQDLKIYLEMNLSKILMEHRIDL